MAKSATSDDLRVFRGEPSRCKSDRGRVGGSDLCVPLALLPNCPAGRKSLEPSYFWYDAHQTNFAESQRLYPNRSATLCSSPQLHLVRAAGEGSIYATELQEGA